MHARPVRRFGISIGLLALCLATAASGLRAGESPGTQAAQTSQPGAWLFTHDAGMLFIPVKADKAADFDMAMEKLKEALQKSEDPVRKQQADGWKVFRQVEPGPGGAVLYVFVIDPVVKDADYAPSKILGETLPTEAAAIFAKYREAFAGGAGRSNLQLVAGMKP